MCECVHVFKYFRLNFIQSPSHHKDTVITRNWLVCLCWFLQGAVEVCMCVCVRMRVSVCVPVRACMHVCLCVSVWQRVGKRWVFVPFYTKPISSNPPFNGRIGGNLIGAWWPKPRPVHLQWTSVWTAKSKGFWFEQILLAFHADGLQIKPLACWENLPPHPVATRH